MRHTLMDWPFVLLLDLAVGAIVLAIAIPLARSSATAALRDAQGARSQAREAQDEAAHLRESVTTLEAELAGVRAELQSVRDEVAEVAQNVAAPPPPPLPRARTSGLDDLREQLRASQREAALSEDDDEDE